MFPPVINRDGREYALKTEAYDKSITTEQLEKAAKRLDVRYTPDEVLARIENYIRKYGPVSGTDTIRGAFGDETKTGFNWDPFFETLRKRNKVARYKADNNRNLYLASP